MNSKFSHFKLGYIYPSIYIVPFRAFQFGDSYLKHEIINLSFDYLLFPPFLLLSFYTLKKDLVLYFIAFCSFPISIIFFEHLY